jgi:hypothetical protein
MTSPNEICEKCGHTKAEHISDGNYLDEECILIEKGVYCPCKKFTPKIEKTEVQTICPLGETIPDFTPRIEKKGFSAPNCEICKDYPKEYWCGNPENKVSTPDEEIIEKVFKKIEFYEGDDALHPTFITIHGRRMLWNEITPLEFEGLIREITEEISFLKEQEVSKITDEYYNWMKIATDYEKKYKELLSSYYKLQDTLLIERANNRQLLSSLQEKIDLILKTIRGKIEDNRNRYTDIIPYIKRKEEELQKIFKEKGQ